MDATGQPEALPDLFGWKGSLYVAVPADAPWTPLRGMTRPPCRRHPGDQRGHCGIDVEGPLSGETDRPLRGHWRPLRVHIMHPGAWIYGFPTRRRSTDALLQQCPRELGDIQAEQVIVVLATRHDSIAAVTDEDDGWTQELVVVGGHRVAVRPRHRRGQHVSNRRTLG